MRNLVRIKLPLSLFPFLIALCFVSTGWAADKRGLPDFTQLVKELSPAVVNISTSQKVKMNDQQSPHGRGMPGAPLDDFFRRFFGDENGGMEEFDTKSLGSGFVISNDGYILTNNHVIQDADEIIVRLSDRREFTAKVIGMDKRSDVAVLKIDADKLPVVKFGKSMDLEVGEWVLAIGSPFGFDHTVTAGIVSAKGRSLPSENYVPFIQTDVAINPGNSGGPLFNLDGEVVGVDSQIYSRTGGFMGLSFSIPIDVAMNVVDQIKTKGHVTRGWLGILIQDVTRELAESFNMQKPTGALVARVLPDSPAIKADIKVGDVIVEFNGNEVISSSNLPPMVGSTRVGEKVPVKIIRDGKPVQVKVEIGELPQEEDLALADDEGSSEVNVKRIAVVVSDLDDTQLDKLEEGKSGVHVESVKSGPAAKAGVHRGDIILMVDNKNIEDAKQFKNLINDLPAGKSVPLLVQRRSGPVFLALKIEEEG